MDNLKETERKENDPSQVKIAQILFYLIGGIWLVLAAITFINRGGMQSGYWLIALLMVGNGAALIMIGLGLRKYRRLFFRLGLALVAVNILLTFTDQFGLWDLLTLIIDLALFNVLILNRRHFQD
jgi:hypothetical protein